jgi:hypothetical protein
MIFQIIIAVVASGGFWTLLQTAITAHQRKKSAETRLILGIAFDRLCERAEHHIEDGFITTDDYNDLVKYLYQPYRDMGGNGTVERLMLQVKALPTHKEGAHA